MLGLHAVVRFFEGDQAVGRAVARRIDQFAAVFLVEKRDDAATLVRIDHDLVKFVFDNGFSVGLRQRKRQLGQFFEVANGVTAGRHRRIKEQIGLITAVDGAFGRDLHAHRLAGCIDRTQTAQRMVVFHGQRGVLSAIPRMRVEEDDGTLAGIGADVFGDILARAVADIGGEFDRFAVFDHQVDERNLVVRTGDRVVVLAAEDLPPRLIERAFGVFRTVQCGNDRELFGGDQQVFGKAVCLFEIGTRERNAGVVERHIAAGRLKRRTLAFGGKPRFVAVGCGAQFARNGKSRFRRGLRHPRKVAVDRETGDVGHRMAGVLAEREIPRNRIAQTDTAAAMIERGTVG